MMCLLHPIGDGDLGGTLSAPRLLEVTGVQLSPSSGSTGSLLLASLPSSFSESFSDSAELDSSSDSSLFPLSGLGERSKDSQKRGRGSPPPGRPDQTKINGTDFMTQVSESRVLSSYMYQHILPFFSILNFWHFSVRKLGSLHLKEILCRAIFDLYLCIVHTPIVHRAL